MSTDAQRSRKHRASGAADYLGVSKSFLDKERAAGRGPAYELVAGKVWYDQSDLDAYRRACRVEPTEGPHQTTSEPTS
jgi:hypothetical protein